jgi:hypothetical protein
MREGINISERFTILGKKEVSGSDVKLSASK